MSKWTHAICDGCWGKRNPGRLATVLINKNVEICCFCGEKTTAGIYVRAEPSKLLCKGKHNE
jgi:hypothetical protein